jgi:hypothetical protein
MPTRSSFFRHATPVIRANAAATALVCLLESSCSHLTHHFQLHAATGQFSALKYLLTEHLSPSYYASKACTYTDSAGRPVPAPRSFKQEREPPQNQLQPGPSNADYRTSSYGTQAPYPADTPRYAQQHRAYPPASASSAVSIPPELSDDDRINRKRFRNDRGNPISSEDIFLDGPIVGMTLDRPGHVELDHSLTWELTNRKLSLILTEPRALLTPSTVQSSSLIATLPVRSSTSPHFQMP